MTVDLPLETAKTLESLIESGEFETAEAAIGECVRLLAVRNKLRADIQKGIDELDSGQWIEGKVVFAELRERAQRLSEHRGS